MWSGCERLARANSAPMSEIVAHKVRTVLLLGAGFSRWSCGLPLVSELFDFKIHPDNSTEEKRLNRLQKIYASWKKANSDSNNEEFVRFSQEHQKRFNLTNWYVTRRLSEPFIVQSGRRYTWYINSHYPQRHQGIRRAYSVIDAFRQSATVPVGIVTTNYDLIPEYALGTRGFNYGKIGEQIGYTPYPYPSPVRAVGSTSISKLHGSISWDSERKYPDCRCGLSGKCLIVPPITEKEALELLKQQWLLAADLLSECRNLIVFGFAFNEHDQAIRKFIRDQVPPAATVTLVDIIDHRPRLGSIFQHQNVEFLSADESDLIKKLEDAARF